MTEVKVAIPWARDRNSGLFHYLAMNSEVLVAFNADINISFRNPSLQIKPTLRIVYRTTN